MRKDYSGAGGNNNYSSSGGGRSRQGSQKRQNEEPYITNLNLQTKNFKTEEDSKFVMTSDSADVGKALKFYQIRKDSSGKFSPELVPVQHLTEKKLPVAQRNKKGNIYMIDFQRSSDHLQDSHPTLETFINAGKRSAQQKFDLNYRRSTEAFQTVSSTATVVNMGTTSGIKVVSTSGTGGTNRKSIKEKAGLVKQSRNGGILRPNIDNMRVAASRSSHQHHQKPASNKRNSIEPLTVANRGNNAPISQTIQ